MTPFLPENLKLVSQKRLLMGNQFELGILVENEVWGQEKLAEAIEEIRRIEALFSTFKADSQTNRINNEAGIKPAKVDREVFELIQRSIKISDLTQGAFDISYGSIDKKLWNFDKTMTALPPKEVALEMVRLINYRNIELNESESTVFLKEKGMRIGFGGIGKGYSADCAKAYLKKCGIENGIVNASGDLTTWGKQANGENWTIGIVNPDAQHQAFSALNISNYAIATSGDYEKYIEIEGKRYSHTINPKTGLPISGIKSVSILAPSAELADALTTPVMIMGIKVGLHLINQLKGIGCIVIDENNKIWCSDNIKF